MGSEREDTVPRAFRRIWTRVLSDALARPEIERELERSGLADEREALDAACRRAVLRRAGTEIEALRAARGRLRQAVGNLVFGLGFASISVITLLEPETAGLSFPVLSRLPAWLLLVISSAAAVQLAVAVTTTSSATVRRRRAGSDLAAAIQALLVPRLRREINIRLRVRFDVLQVRDTEGLSETVDPSLEVGTRARDELTALMGHMRSGAIGVSGSRGAGKSTLIRAACDGRLTPTDRDATIGVSVAAPVRWDSNDFVPLLFGALCEKVARPSGERTGFPETSWREVITLYLGLSVGVGLVALAIAVGNGSIRVDAQSLAVAALVVAAVAAFASSGAVVARGMPNASLIFARALRRPVSLQLRRALLPAAAERSLRALRFRETVVQGWSVGAKASFGLSLDGRRELTSTEQPLTLPEVVERYKAFVRRVAQDHTVVIGIDELDKMESAEEAASFLGEIKVLFGEQPCFYLVSLSDDAMSAFERRGVPLRTIFDSTFDDVLHVDTLSFEESRAVVSGRVVGMGDGYVALCHMLGGGVPRELVRCVRGTIEADRRGASTPAAVARELVGDRLRRLERAMAAVASRQATPDGKQPLLEWLQGLPPLDDGAFPARWQVGTLHAALSGRALERQRAQLVELAAVAYRGATVVALCDGLDDNVMEAATRGTQPSPIFALLARAGHDLALGPRVAWRTLDAARREMGLPLVPFPLDEPPTRPATANGARWRRVAASLVTGA